MRGKIELLLALGLVLSTSALATPTGPTVVTGNVQFQQNGNTLRIQNSPNSIINWQSFSIGSGEVTNFVQPSSSSVVLNRVTGGAVSQFLGSLQSNGSVYLINANGVVFGAGAQVSTASFIATTANVSDASFLAGNPFQGTSTGSTLNVSGEFSMISGVLNLGPSSITGDASFTTSGTLSLDAPAGIQTGILAGATVLGAGGTVTGGSPTVRGAPLTTGTTGGGSGGIVLTGTTTTTSAGSGGFVVVTGPIAATGPAVAAAPTVSGTSTAMQAAATAPRVAEVGVTLQKREPLY